MEVAACVLAGLRYEASGSERSARRQMSYKDKQNEKSLLSLRGDWRNNSSEQLRQSRQHSER
jgi:hypothetical protein